MSLASVLKVISLVPLHVLQLDDGGLAPPVKSASPVMKAGAVDQQQSQLVMLRKALAEANSRLSSAGLEPVALPSTTAAYQVSRPEVLLASLCHLMMPLHPTSQYMLE